MFDTIVWPTDGTEFADRALPLVTELARERGARIVAVHVNELMTGRLGHVPALADEDELRARIVRQVAALRASGFDAVVRVETTSSRGIAEVIAQAAEDVDAKLVVLATRAHLLASVTKSLLHRAPCPVLVVPPEEPVETPKLEEAVTA